MARVPDKSALGQFLRARREAFQPHDVGLPRGPRRRAKGLRREEVAELCAVSVDYIGRLERGTGSWPSPDVLAALARGLRLTKAERDHLYLLCGRVNSKTPAVEHLEPGMQRILDRLHDTPALVMGQAGITIRQTPLAVALVGDETSYRGLARSFVYRWFTDPRVRYLYLPDDHEYMGRAQASLLREDRAHYGPGSFAGEVVNALAKESDEFHEIWNRGEVGIRLKKEKRLVHPVVGRLDLFCQTLIETESRHTLLVYTATPGSDSYERLTLLNIMGAEPIGLR